MHTLICRLVLALGIVLTVGYSHAVAQTQIIGTHTTTDTLTGKTVTTYDTVYQVEQDVTPRWNLISINPFKFFLDYNLSYYRRFGDRWLVGLGGMVSTSGDPMVYGVNAEVRWYTKPRAPRGFFVSSTAYLSWAKLQPYYYAYDWDPSTQTIMPTQYNAGGVSGALVIGLNGGWQWFPSDEFAVSLTLGLDNWISVFHDNYWDRQPSYPAFAFKPGIAPSLRFEIGYGW